LTVHNANSKISKVLGHHKVFYSNSWVNDLKIIGETVVHIPNGIDDFFPGLKKLGIMRSKLKFIKRVNFEPLKNLKDLRLDNNEIEVILSDTFWDLKSLTWLSISGNKIKSLDEGWTSMNQQLLWFSANDNQIEILNQKYFRRNLAIELISLRNNKLTEVTFNFKRFKKLNYVDLRNNVCIDSVVCKWEKFSTFYETQKKVRENCTKWKNLVIEDY
jgi:Leucine-rich repeat (LRR) protein